MFRHTEFVEAWHDIDELQSPRDGLRVDDSIRGHHYLLVSKIVYGPMSKKEITTIIRTITGRSLEGGGLPRASWHVIQGRRHGMGDSGVESL